MGSNRPAARARTSTKLLPPPSPAVVQQAMQLLRPWHWLTSPQSFGIENVPAHGRILLVGNHTLLGVFDVPVMMYELASKRGVFPRALGDHLHFRVPFWRDMLARLGVVDGTRENCAALMKANQPVLVFPGGGREVAKRKGEKYQLLWKNRIGFARLAIRYGVPIVPFAAVGAEEAFDIVLDADDLFAPPLQAILERFGVRTDVIIPVVRGIGPTMIPRPERFYFYFGKPIDTCEYQGRWKDDDACRNLRDKVEKEVRRGIRFLRAKQRADPQRNLMSRILAGLAPTLTLPRAGSGTGEGS